MELKKWIAAISIALVSHIVHAVYPDRPIKIVVAFAPGSSTDIVARTIGQNLSIALGQPVIIENKPGAGGNIGTVMVAKSAADGYTLLMHSVAISVNPTLFNNAGYDINKDLAGVAMGAVSPNIIYVHPDFKAYNLKDIANLAGKEIKNINTSD